MLFYQLLSKVQPIAEEILFPGEFFERLPGHSRRMAAQIFFAVQKSLIVYYQHQRYPRKFFILV